MSPYSRSAHDLKTPRVSSSIGVSAAVSEGRTAAVTETTTSRSVRRTGHAGDQVEEEEEALGKEDEDVTLDPRCSITGCGGLIKPDLVLFGEPLQEKAIERVMEAATSCDTILCVGSTLSVFPVAAVVPLAVQSGAKCVIVNRGRTKYDHLADAKVDVMGGISDILPRLCCSAAVSGK